MIEKFWETIGENITGDLRLRHLGTILVFWGGGLLIWFIKDGFSPFFRLSQITALQAGLIFILIFSVMILSNSIITSLTLPLLYLFEGYWTLWPFNHLRLWLTSLLRKRWQNLSEGEYQKLTKATTHLDQIQTQRLAHLDTELITAFPKQYNLFLPTMTGNLLRSAEEYPQYWYGLQVEITWPRLWLLLPEEVQKEITTAHQEFESNISRIGWSILFSIWVGISWWAVVISVLSAIIFCRRMYATGRVYGQLICSAYDLYRFVLYSNLGWPLPINPNNEREKGEQVNQFLRRRITPIKLKYSHNKMKK